MCRTCGVPSKIHPVRPWPRRGPVGSPARELGLFEDALRQAGATPEQAEQLRARARSRAAAGAWNPLQDIRRRLIAGDTIEELLK